MESFATYFKKHGLMLWLVNLLGSVAGSTAVFFVGFIIFVLTFMTGIATLMAFDFSSINIWSTNILEEIFANLQKASIGIIGILVLLLIFVGFSLIVGSFQVAGQYVSAAEIFQSNRARITTYFTKGFKYTPKMCLLTILISLFYLPLLRSVGFVIYLFLPIEDPSHIFLLIIIGIVAFLLSVLLGLAILHAPFILIAENMGIFKSIILSFRLFSQNFGQVFITCLLIWGVSFCYVIGGIIFYVIGGIIFYVPFLFTFDTSGILITITSLGSNSLQWLYSLVGWPFMVAMIGLIVAYRYYKYLRPQLFPQEMTKNEYNDPIFKFK